MKYRIEEGNSAEIQWKFKCLGWTFNRFTFTLKNNILTVKAYSIFKYKKSQKLGTIQFAIEDFQSKTALQVFEEHSELDSPFRDACLNVWKDLNLPLGFITSTLKDLGRC